MKHGIIVAMLGLSFAACTQPGDKVESISDSTNKANPAITDTSASIHGSPDLPAGTSGNTAVGTSNAGAVGTDTAAVGTNRNLDRDANQKKNKNGQRKSNVDSIK